MTLAALGLGALVLSTEFGPLKPPGSGEVVARLPEKGGLFCAQVAEPPVLDGKLDDAAWRKAELVSGFFTGLEGTLSTALTNLRVVHDGRKLYLAVECFEAGPASIVLNRVGRDSSVWEDTSVEVFIDTNCDRRTYKQFIANARGERYDGLTRDGSKDFDWDAKALIDPSGKKWVVEIAIPLFELAEPKGVWGFMCGRNRYNPSEHSSWPGMPPGWHNPGHFGYMRFERKPSRFDARLERLSLGKNEVLFLGTPAKAEETVVLSVEANGKRSEKSVRLPAGRRLEEKVEFTVDEAGTVMVKAAVGSGGRGLASFRFSGRVLPPVSAELAANVVYQGEQALEARVTVARAGEPVEASLLSRDGTVASESFTAGGELGKVRFSVERLEPGDYVLKLALPGGQELSAPFIVVPPP